MNMLKKKIASPTTSSPAKKPIEEPTTSSKSANPAWLETLIADTKKAVARLTDCSKKQHELNNKPLKDKAAQAEKQKHLNENRAIWLGDARDLLNEIVRYRTELEALETQLRHVGVGVRLGEEALQ